MVIFSDELIGDAASGQKEALPMFLGRSFMQQLRSFETTLHHLMRKER